MSYIKILILLLAAGVVGIFFWQSTKVNYVKGSLRENTKIKIDDHYSFTLRFAEKPKVGTTILKISILNQKGEMVNDLSVSASYHMPSMPSMSFKNQDFVQNKKGEYLLPINLGMPGDWEIEIIFKKDLHELYKGKITFEL